VDADGEGSTGMLVVESVVPGGPADGVLEPGDVLVRLQGRVVVHFLPMEALLDDHVGRCVTVEVERGGRLITAEIKVCSSASLMCPVMLHPAWKLASPWIMHLFSFASWSPSCNLRLQ
jgi:predicted metalloprotease with PDZ domain